MKRVKKWALLLVVAGPVVTNFSCTTAFVREFRDAAIDGFGAFVASETTQVLQANVSLTGD